MSAFMTSGTPPRRCFSPPGGSLRDAQELLGHTSFTLTANTYAHVLDAQRKATADRLEVAIGEAIAGSRESVKGT
jgi:hypothetical protein